MGLTSPTGHRGRYIGLHLKHETYDRLVAQTAIDERPLADLVRLYILRGLEAAGNRPGSCQETCNCQEERQTA